MKEKWSGDACRYILIALLACPDLGFPFLYVGGTVDLGAEDCRVFLLSTAETTDA